MSKILSTTVVGSYPQPDWLIDAELLKGQTVPRVRIKHIWRIPEPQLESAQDDATLIAIRDMERAGIDVITDGEMRRESYSNRFATALGGIDNDNPVESRRAPAERPACRVWPARSSGRARSRSATSPSFAPTPTAASRSRCPAPSPWPAGRR